MSNRAKWLLLAVGLASLYIAHPVAGGASSTSSSSTSDGAITSGRYVRLQLEDLELPDGHGTSPDDVTSSDCLPLATDGDLSSICSRSAARYPDLFDHVDEEHSSARLRLSAGEWLDFLRSPSFATGNGNGQLSAEAVVTMKLCRDRLSTFVCAMHSPPCASLSRRQTSGRSLGRQISCRQMCESARNGCSADVHRWTSPVVPRDWPDQWNCRKIPVDLMCDYSLQAHQRFISGRRHTLTGGIRTVLQPSPPVSTLPLPPRTRYDLATSSASSTARLRHQQRHRQHHHHRRSTKTID